MRPVATTEIRSDAPDSSLWPFDPILVGAGLQIAGRSLVRRVRGWRRFPGSVEAICRAVVETCWDGRRFGGSAGHFRQFWTRDLAMCTPALVRLGQRDRVVASWAWALERFERAGRITTTIFFDRFPRDVYGFAADSLPFLLWALHEADAPDLVDRHRAFITREIDRFVARVRDPDTGLVRATRYLSGPRDCITGASTTFANACLALLEHLLAETPTLPNPLAGAGVARRLLEQRWTGTHFRDALDRAEPTGDANLWPFVLGVVGDPALARSAVETLEAGGFTRPVPLRYFARRVPQAELPVPRLATPNYEGDTCWMQMAPLYVSLLRRLGDERWRGHHARLAELIARDGNYLELYTRQGVPYSGRAGVYLADEGMIWASLYLDAGA